MKKLVIYLLIFLNLLLIGMHFGLTWINKQAEQAMLEAEAEAQQALEAKENSENVLLELEALEKYYRDNGLFFPQGYQELPSGLRKIGVLRSKIVDREVGSVAGGYIITAFSSESNVNIKPGTLKEIARLKIEEYHTRALSGEAIAELVNAASSDELISRINEKTTNKSEMFENSSSEELLEYEVGEVSPIIERSGSFYFYVITDKNEKNYDTYEAWLWDVTLGKLSKAN